MLLKNTNKFHTELLNLSSMRLKSLICDTSQRRFLKKKRKFLRFVAGLLTFMKIKRVPFACPSINIDFLDVVLFEQGKV